MVESHSCKPKGCPSEILIVIVDRTIPVKKVIHL